MALIYGTYVTTVPVDVEQEMPAAYVAMRAQAVMNSMAIGDRILPGPPERVTHVAKNGREMAHYHWPIAREVQS